MTALQSTVMQKGDRVLVSAAYYTTVAEVLDVRAVDEFPPVPGAPDVNEVKAIMGEFGIAEVAHIGYHVDGRDVVFTALHLTNGEWCDLKRTPLTIEKL